MLALVELVVCKLKPPLAPDVRERPEGSWLPGTSQLEGVYDSLTGSDPEMSKWVHYFEIYERHLARFRGEAATICEVGVNTGGSLKAYRNYFGERATIIGVDLFNSSFMEDNPVYGRPRMFVGDQGSAAFWRSFRERVRRASCSTRRSTSTATMRASTRSWVPSLRRAS